MDDLLEWVVQVLEWLSYIEMTKASKRVRRIFMISYGILIMLVLYFLFCYKGK